MLTNRQIKLIKSLTLKKNREKHQLFVAEGEKIVKELYNSTFEIKQIFSTSKTNYNNSEIISDFEMNKISNQKKPSGILALIKIPNQQIEINQLKNKITLALDDIQDPGNLGTIIRIADWFGIQNIICSNNSVDIYNPKVVQSTMGSITRVNVYYENLIDTIKATKIKSYATVIEGKNIFQMTDKISEGIIVFGNESNGIHHKLQNIINEKINVPRVGNAESLNVAVACGIVCAEFYRNIII